MNAREAKMCLAYDERRMRCCVSVLAVRICAVCVKHDRVNKSTQNASKCSAHVIPASVLRIGKCFAAHHTHTHFTFGGLLWVWCPGTRTRPRSLSLFPVWFWSAGIFSSPGAPNLFSEMFTYQHHMCEIFTVSYEPYFHCRKWAVYCSIRIDRLLFAICSYALIMRITAKCERWANERERGGEGGKGTGRK